MEAQLLNLLITVSGKVQGVFFRAKTKETADKLRINGWVRNLENGSVEINAEGTEEQLKLFLTWCHKGPLLARVSELNYTPGEVKNYTTFEIIK